MERVTGNFRKLDYIGTYTDKNGYFKAVPLPEWEYTLESYFYDHEKNTRVTEIRSIKVRVGKSKLKKIKIFLKARKKKNKQR